MKSHACLSSCRKYRYSLHRVWDADKPSMVVIGLNPSTADETIDDPTIRRCMTYARDWGFGGLIMLNLFAYRATDPAAMMAQDSPIGEMNDQYIEALTKSSTLVLAAWGNDGLHMDRAKVVAAMLPNLMCLKINKNGQPAHPLYQRKDAQPIPYKLEK